MSIGLTWDPRLTNRRVQLTTYSPRPGETYFRLIRARYLDPDESRGRHHVFVDVWDEFSKRMVGVPVTFFWASGMDTKLTEQKPGESHAVDFPMYASGYSYGVRASGIGSDSVNGMGLGTVEQPHVGHHVSYHLIFQRATAAVIAPPVEPPPIGNDLDWNEVLRHAQELAGLARRHIDGGN